MMRLIRRLAEHDVAIRWGRQVSSSLIVTKIGESRQITCAAPAYLERFGIPARPQDLASHNCLLMTRLGTTHNDWAFRQPNGKVTAIRVTGNFTVNGGHGNYEALLSGLGIARVTDLRAREDIAMGRLQPLMTAFEPAEATPILAAYKSGRLVPPKYRAFVNFLQRRFMGKAKSEIMG